MEELLREMEREILNCKKFLSSIHGEDNINFRVISGKDSSSALKIKGKNDDETMSKLKGYNESGYNIYFVVNGGGDTDDSIEKINAIFVDFDIPKDTLPTNNNMLQFKSDCLKKLANGLSPSYVVETRKGIHAYWVLESESFRVSEFKTIQKKLIEMFGSDSSINNPSRLMRLPDFNCMKNCNEVGFTPFGVKVVDGSQKVYRRDEIVSWLFRDGSAESSEGVLGVTNNEVIYSLYVTGKSPLHTNETVEMLKNKDSESLKLKYAMSKKVVHNKQELNDYIRSVDLRVVLGIEHTKNIRCIFHADKNPSANVFKCEDGSYIYKCHSDSCGVSYNILNIVEVLGQFKSRPRAYDFICEILNVELVMSEKQIEQVRILDDNINFLVFKLKKDYPKVYANMRHQVDYLIKLNQLAKSRVVDFSLSDNDGFAMFFANLGEMCEVAGISKKRRNSIVSKNCSLQYHLLINKLSDKKLPDVMLKKSKSVQKQYNLPRRVNYYSIPSYTTTLMDMANQQAEKWVENCYTVTGASIEMFARKEGVEMVEKIFPQHSKIKDVYGKLVDVSTTATQDEINSQLAHVIMELIEEKGYCTEKEVVSHGNFGKSTAIKHIKINLPEIIDAYDLKRVRLNRFLKEKLDQDIKGYPFVIMKSEFYDEIVEQVEK